MLSHDKMALSHRRHGQENAKDCAFADFRVDFDSTLVRFDDAFALEHADAYPLSFGGLKRSKKGLLNKFRGHTTAVVTDGKYDAAILAAGFHFDAPRRLNRITRI